MPYLKTLIISLLALVSINAIAQKDTLTFEQQLAQLELEMDSMSIFLLIDSLIANEYKKKSELSVRMNYNSNILSAGRDFGANQHGLSPGISFYHKSGAYVDLSGFWNNSLSPKYNLSVASIGYMSLIGKKMTISSSFDKWVYHASSSENLYTYDLTNSLNAGAAINTKHLYGSLDYNFLFGNKKTTHRIIAAISGNLKLKKTWIFDRVRVLPSVNTIFGNDDVITFTPGTTLGEFAYNEYFRENFQSEDFQAFLQGVALASDEQRLITQVRNNSNLSLREKSKRIARVYATNTAVQSYIYEQTSDLSSSNSYGLLNYSFSLPVLLTIKNFTILISYAYSVPVSLPGETYDLSPSGYFSSSISYSLPLR